MNRQNERRFEYVARRWYLLPPLARFKVVCVVGGALITQYIRNRREQVAMAGPYLFGLVVLFAVQDETPLVAVSVTALAAFYAQMVSHLMRA